MYNIISKYIHLDHPENEAIKKAVKSAKTLDEAFKAMESNFLITQGIVDKITAEVKTKV